MASDKESSEGCGDPDICVNPDENLPYNNYRLAAWFSCACFCPPIGLVSVIHSLRADRCAARGDYESAKEAGESAKKWAIAAAIAMMVMLLSAGVVYLVYTFFAVSGKV